MKKFGFSRWLVGGLCLLSLILTTPAAAQFKGGAPEVAKETIPEPTALHLKTGKVPLTPEVSLHAVRAAPLEAAGHYVLQLDGPLTSERLGALTDAGIVLGQYLPTNAYIVKLDAGFNPAGQVGGLDFVRWVGPFENDWKLDPEIGQQVFQSPDRIDLANQGLLKLTVALFEGADLDAASNAIAAMPGVAVLEKDMSGNMGLIELTMPQQNFQALANLSVVQWVEEAGEATLRNDTNGWILQSYTSNLRSIWAQGIRGDGQIGGVIDSGVRQDHCSFNGPGKIVAYFGSTSPGSHGTHVAGTFLGDENPANGVGFRGMAYMARLAFTNLNTVTSTNLYSKFEQNRNAGARIHTNSWGNDGTTSYTTWSRDIDRFTHTFEDDVVLYAVTNINDVIRTPENAKNCIGVAACTDFPATNHCTGGFAPTQDGRRKPELMAPGCSTISSQSSTTCGFTGVGFTGTSMACPAVAGAGLLVRQYYMDGFYPTGTANAADGFTPSGALIKATLINSGTDVTGISGFPSPQEGWGRVLLENALNFAGQTRRLMVLEDRRNADGLVTGNEVHYQFNCFSTSFPLKVTLVWTEKEAALNANPAYINDLNLEVRSAGQATYLGNVFSGGQSVVGGSADFRNNVEQVLINTPTVGRHTVTVRAPAVNTTTPQGFALIVTGAVKPLDGPTMTLATPEPLP